jgi:antitoxin component of MazEF toxin-antitoxin module
MRARLRRLGNSRGVILPKPVLAQLGIEQDDSLDLTVEHDRIVLRRLPVAPPRAGWAAEAAEIAAAGDDALVWNDFDNLAENLAGRMRLEKGEAVKRALRNEIDRIDANLPLRERLRPLQDRVLSRPATGMQADKSFFDALSGDP